MAATRITVTSNTARLEALIRALPGRSVAGVDTTASNIRDRAAANAPRDTGSLAASIYINNGETSDYAQRSGQARSLNRDVEILEEVRPDLVISLSGGDSGGYSAVVGVAAAHGEPVEFGTRFMSAQPYMTPAVEPERDQFVALMSRVADV